ncbi:cytosolic carboxypeptidase 3 isoform X3 [Cavia porcellus]|uniref:cytosolic carboxypeptidase 3 isoform X3 n=1 Tax=Cavia porcellus TaxID=10141 RepID=UPI002FE1188F
MTWHCILEVFFQLNYLICHLLSSLKKKVKFNIFEYLFNINNTFHLKSRQISSLETVLQPTHTMKEISSQILKEMSEDSDKEDYSDGTISDEDESDEDTFMKFVSEDIHQCALLTADSSSDPFFPRTTQILLEYQLGRWVRRLREPRDLYGVSSSGPLSPTRWPYHCEVIDEKVQHIDWAPFCPEPVYIPTGLEMEPLYPSSKEDTVVYLAEDAYKEPCFVYSRVGGNRTPLRQPVDGCDNTLMFEARFESGNLQKVVKVAEYEYQLTVRPDLFTNKHTQWYYFQVTNTQAEMVYRFTIVNFIKPASLYNRGMRPLFYSEKEAKIHHIGWQRIGDQIKYYRNNLGQDGRHFFSLTWTFQFPHNKDTCYFAHCYPYTYTNLQEYLSGINNDPVRSRFCKIRVLCHTLARNMVYVLTITTPLKNTDSRKRKAVILTARVHPGETNSSWIMKGFLDYILGDSHDAQLLRDTFVFKFSFSSCKFNVQKSKEGTGRVVMWKMGIRNSFTMEATFCGSTLGNKRGTHFNTKDLESMGYHFCDSLLDYCDPDRSKYYQCLKELEEMEKRMNMEKVFEDSDSCPREITLDIESSSRGSDSSESNDSQTYLLKVTSQIKTKKKYLKTKKERNSTIEKHQNVKAEVYDREHLLQTHKESNSNAKAKISERAPYLLKRYLSSQSMTQSLGKDQHRYFLDICERPIQKSVQPKENDLYGSCFQVTSLKCPMTRQTSRWIAKTKISTDLHDNLKSKVKDCTSFQSKKTGINWTDDEKRVYRNKRTVPSQELLRCFLPIVNSSKNIKTGQIKQPISQQIKQASCINIKRYSPSWTAPRNPLFIAPKSLMPNTSTLLQCAPQKPLGRFSAFKGHKRKKGSQAQATKTEDTESLSSKWESASPSFEMNASILQDKSLPAKESNLQEPKQIDPHLTKNKSEQPNKNDGLQRDD